MARLLVAEDNEFSRELLMRRLENAGYQVIGAENGQEALLAARQYHPDLILMDLEMPVMDGRAAIRTLKTDPHTSRIPIIVVSSDTTPATLEESISVGCAGFQEKPVFWQGLLDRIGETLQTVPGAAGPLN